MENCSVTVACENEFFLQKDSESVSQTAQKAELYIKHIPYGKLSVIVYPIVYLHMHSPVQLDWLIKGRQSGVWIACDSCT
jgi:hypothetical protein